MDQTRFKKIIKISSFFFLALVTYLIYYPTISPEPAKREGISKNHSRTESEERYRIGVSQVNDFQKIGNIALAIDKFGEVQEKDGYLVAQNYKLPEDPYPDEGKAFYDKKEQLLCKILYNFLSFSFDFQFELCDNENIS